MATQADLVCGGVLVTASTAGEDSHIVSTAPSLYFGIDGRNTDASNAVYIWVFDATTVPANGTISSGAAKHVISVPAGLNFAHGPVTYGEYFANGIVLVSSSTDFPTLTITATSKVFFSCASAKEYGQF